LVRGVTMIKKVEITARVKALMLKKAIISTLLSSLMATCTSPSYAIASRYHYSNNDSFILVDTVAVSGNNDRQEPRNLLTTVSHRTLADVFLCLSFASLAFTGELRLAIALIALWWGGSGNKPFIRRIPLAVLLRFSSLPAALTLGQIIKTNQTKPNQTKPTQLICAKPFVNQPKTPVNEAQTESGGFYEYLKRRKSKGHDAQTSQPFKH